MIVEPPRNRVISSVNVGKTTTYGIKSPQIMMETMAGLYSNQKKIICQEYMCNARDAHREVNTPDVPIHVVLPTELDPQLTIQDFGPGLSEERVNEVFTIFGESTKRDSNNETGGFGIGAKCAFAYCDAFFVETVVNSIKSVYSVLKNSGNGLPGMTLMSMNETCEANGTKIIIPINDNDITDIHKYVYTTAKHWDVKPIVENKDMDWPVYDVVLEGDGWKLLKTEKERHYGFQGKPEIILDGIPYPVPDTVFENIPYEMKNIKNLNIHLFFKTGEIDPAVNRESIKVNEKTTQKINDRLIHAYNTFKIHYTNLINNAKNLYEANLLWDRTNDEIGAKWLLSEMTYNGFKLNKDYQEFINDVVYTYKRSDFNGDSVKFKKGSKLYFLNNSVLVVNNDTTIRPSIPRIISIFKNSNYENIQVLNLNEGGILEHSELITALGAVNITEWEKVKRTYDRSTTLSCYLFKGNNTKDSHCWKSVDVDLMSINGIYVNICHKKADLSPYYLEKIKTISNLPVYGIPNNKLNTVTKNPNLIGIKAYIKKEIKNILNTFHPIIRNAVIDIIKEKHDIVSLDTMDIFLYDKVVPLLDRNHSLKINQRIYKFVNRIRTKKNFSTLKHLYSSVCHNGNEYNTTSFINKAINIYEKYPLLKCIRGGSMLENPEIINDLVEYIKNKG